MHLFVKLDKNCWSSLANLNLKNDKIKTKQITRIKKKIAYQLKHFHTAHRSYEKAKYNFTFPAKSTP